MTAPFRRQGLSGDGYPDYDSLSAKQINANTAEFRLKKAGKAMGTTRRTVSKDGTTLTATTRLTDANGAKSEQVTAYDKQQ